MLLASFSFEMSSLCTNLGSIYFIFFSCWVILQHGNKPIAMLLYAREENQSHTILQVELLFFSFIKVLPYWEMSALHEHQQINVFEQKCDDRLDMHLFSLRTEIILRFVYSASCAPRSRGGFTLEKCWVIFLIWIRVFFHC